jgi:hypothetical protein
MGCNYGFSLDGVDRENKGNVLQQMRAQERGQAGLGGGGYPLLSGGGLPRAPPARRTALSPGETGDGGSEGKTRVKVEP